jgi:hypothetical protein
MRELSHKIDVTSLAREAPVISPPIASNKRFHPALPAIARRRTNGGPFSRLLYRDATLPGGLLTIRLKICPDLLPNLIVRRRRVRPARTPKHKANEAGHQEKPKNPHELRDSHQSFAPC